MTKKQKRLLIIGIAVAAVAIAIYLYLRSRNSTSGDNDGDEGNGVAPGGSSNLNSVAPELIGGPTGPQVSPAVSLPVNITLTSDDTSPKPQVIGTPMQSGQRNDDDDPLKRQRKGADWDARRNPRLPGQGGEMGVVPPEDNPGMEGAVTDEYAS